MSIFLKDIIQYLIIGILGFTILSIGITMIQFNQSYPRLFCWEDLPILFIGIILLLGIYYTSTQIIKEKLNGLIIFISGLLIANAYMVWSILTIPTHPCSDFSMIWDIATQMARGDFNISQLNHYDFMYHFNWDLGIASIEGVLLRIFGERFLVLQIFNLICINVTFIGVYYIGNQIGGKKGALIAFVISCIWLPLLATVNQFTNEQLSTGILIFTLICLNKNKWYWWLIAGILCAFMHIARPMGLIVIITAIYLAMYRLLEIKGRNNKGFLPNMSKLHPLGLLILFFVSFKICTFCYDFIMISNEWADSPVTQSKLPYYKFHRGLTGHRDVEIDEHGGTFEDFNKWEKEEVIKAITQAPLTTSVYVIRKYILFLGGFDWKFEFTFNQDMDRCLSNPAKTIYLMGWGEYLTLAMIALFSYFRFRKRNNIDASQIAFVGLSLVYLFIEAYTGYRMESSMLLIVLASLSPLKRVTIKKLLFFGL